MVITFTVILLGLIAFIRPLQKNSFFMLHAALIIGSAWFIETHYFRTSVFSSKTLLLFLVFHLISINIVTVVAYYVDKRAAKKGAWRVPENTLHVLEFFGGWSGALIAQKIFRHKTRKKSFRAMFYLMIVLEFLAVYLILKYLHLI